MILVVTRELNLTFLLQHQGHCLRTTRTAHEALQVLRSALGAIEGVIIDERIENSRLVTAFVRANAPNLQIVPWRIAERNSPFKHVLEPERMIEWKAAPAHRYQLKGKRTV